MPLKLKGPKKFPLSSHARTLITHANEEVSYFPLVRNRTAKADLPTPGAPMIPILTSESDDFLRRIPRIPELVLILLYCRQISSQSHSHHHFSLQCFDLSYRPPTPPVSRR